MRAPNSSQPRHKARSSPNGIYYASLDGRENRLVLHSQSNAVYAAGFLLFGHGNQLMAQAFNPDKGELRGGLQTISSGVLIDLSTWHVDVSATNNGLLAFGSSAESGRLEIYVEAYGGGQGRWQVSPSGGQVPHWSADGKELLYFDIDQSVVAVRVQENEGALQFGAPQTLISRWTVLTTPFFSVSPDGKRILMERLSQQVNQPVALITNFTAGLTK